MCGSGRDRSEVPPGRGSVSDKHTNNWDRSTNLIVRTKPQYLLSMAQVNPFSKARSEVRRGSRTRTRRTTRASWTPRENSVSGHSRWPGRRAGLARWARLSIALAKSLMSGKTTRGPSSSIERLALLSAPLATTSGMPERSSIRVTCTQIWANWTTRKRISNSAEGLWARAGDRRQQAIVRVAKARLEVRRGNYQRALNQFQEALTWLEPIGDAVWVGSSLTGIARVYEEMGETGPALKHRERALRLFEAAGLKIFAVETLSSLGRAYLASGNHSVASQTLRARARARRRNGHRAMESARAPVPGRGSPRSAGPTPGSPIFRPGI